MLHVWSAGQMSFFAGSFFVKHFKMYSFLLQDFAKCLVFWNFPGLLLLFFFCPPSPHFHNCRKGSPLLRNVFLQVKKAPLNSICLKPVLGNTRFAILVSGALKLPKRLLLFKFLVSLMFASLLLAIDYFGHLRAVQLSCKRCSFHFIKTRWPHR